MLRLIHFNQRASRRVNEIATEPRGSSSAKHREVTAEFDVDALKQFNGCAAGFVVRQAEMAALVQPIDRLTGQLNAVVLSDGRNHPLRIANWHFHLLSAALPRAYVDHARRPGE
ncbi:Uncharacterised protein [Mycobacteroides abscessus subsp. abscessus]|nr:Uncharacterised protein [Mycobacteroides abscessus subsp. abscessus]